MCLFGRLAPNVPNSLEYDVPDWSRHDSHVVSPPIYTARFRCCIWVIVFRTVPMQLRPPGQSLCSRTTPLEALLRS